MQRRIAFIEVFFIMIAITIVGRSVLIQFSTPPQLSQLAHRQFKTKITALPSRGRILDRNNNDIAISLKARSLYLRPQVLKQQVKNKSSLKRIARAVALSVHLPAERVYEKMISQKSFIWLKRQLTDQEENLIRELSLDRFNDGIGLAEESRRVYPNHSLASHLLGTVNIDGQGIEGLELYYDAILAGEQTRIQSIKDAKGRSIFMDDKGLLAFRHGKSISLTIDKTIQYEAEKTLKNYVESLNAKSASAIFADAQTGEILAMANYPTYDPNSPKASSLESRRNRVITDAIEPGSTLKPLLMGLALSKGLSPRTQIYCEKGRFKVADRYINEAETHEKFEWLSLTEIIKLSSNIGAAKLAMQLGGDQVGHWLQKLNYGTKTGLDLPGESSGLTTSENLLQSLKSQVRLANVGFGHGISFTPLQIFSLYQAVANKGVWIQPRLVKKVFEEDGSLVHEFKNNQQKILMDPSVAEGILKMLAAVTVDDGTGTKAALDEWTVGGKTGTAQKIDPKTKKYSRNKYLASFVGAAPIKNPRIVGLVMIDEPTNKYYAGVTAAPAFKEIMQAALMRMNVPQDLEVVAEKLAQNNKNALKAMVSAVHKEEAQKPTEMEFDEESGKVRIPELKGKSIREIVKFLSPYPIELEIIGSGVLKEQIPNSTQWLSSGSKVKLVFE